MTTLTTKATYKDGIVIPKTKPSFGLPDEVIVTFIRHKAGNAFATLATLKKYAGLLPANFSSGPIYISKLRKKHAKEWQVKLNSR